MERVKWKEDKWCGYTTKEKLNGTIIVKRRRQLEWWAIKRLNRVVIMVVKLNGVVMVDKIINGVVIVGNMINGWNGYSETDQ